MRVVWLLHNIVILVTTKRHERHKSYFLFVPFVPFCAPTFL